MLHFCAWCVGVLTCADTVCITCVMCSRVSTPVKRKNRDVGGGGRDYGSGQINAYPPPAAGANPAAGAVMMSLAEELLTKKGLSLKDLQVRKQPSFSTCGDTVCGVVLGAAMRCTGTDCGGNNPMFPCSTSHTGTENCRPIQD